MMDEHANKYGKLVFLCTASAYLLFFAFISVGYISKGKNPVKLANPRFLETVYPGGWGYFTRILNEEVYKIYELSGNKFVYKDLHSFTPQFSFGLDRSRMLMELEAQSLAKDTMASAAQFTYNISMPATADINDYLKADTIRFNNRKPDNAFLLHGKMLITEEYPVSWQQQHANKNMPQVIRVIPVNILPR